MHFAFCYRTRIFAPIYICHEYRLMILPLVARERESERASLCCEKNRTRQRERVGEIASRDRNRATLSCERSTIHHCSRDPCEQWRDVAEDARSSNNRHDFLFHTAPKNGWRRFLSAIIIIKRNRSLRTCRYTSSLIAALHTLYII